VLRPFNVADVMRSAQPNFFPLKQFTLPDVYHANTVGHVLNPSSFRLGGPRSALGSAIACGILLGVFEGVGVLLSRVFSEGPRPQLPQCEYSLGPFVIPVQCSCSS